ncbi:MAG: hypothetical protein GX762_09415 [Bacteroidales bacterium]|nr:hypothetical protein [Bacteroidales bacterium]
MKYIIIVAIVLLTVSCSSMKSDAKKAASLVDKSIELSHELKFEKAEKTYLKAQEIINKYIEKDKATEFFEHFAAYRDKEKKQNAK